jgi:hypothetical protein
LAIALCWTTGCQSFKSTASTGRDASTYLVHKHLDFNIAGKPVAELSPAKDDKQYPVRSVYSTGQIVTERPFIELLPSWNADCPPGTGIRFDVRSRDAKSGRWSPWLFIGEWGTIPTERKMDRMLGMATGAIAVDVLELKSPASAFELQATLFTYDATLQTKPVLKRLWAVVTSEVKSEVEREKIVPRPALGVTWQRDLAVPFRAQGVEPETVRHDICSPTSTSMVMEFAGVKLTTMEVAQGVYDNDYDLFGNWGRAVAFAGSRGLNARLMRFAHMDEVRAMIEAGQPVVASIRFKKGEFPSNVAQETAGHLIVIRGFTVEGDAIVNDPASKDRGNGVVYKSGELARAWFVNAGGVGYVISPENP